MKFMGICLGRAVFLQIGETLMTWVRSGVLFGVCVCVRVFCFPLIMGDMHLDHL